MSYGGNVKCLRESHRGRPRRNRGIRAAQAEYVAFVDADDVWRPRKIEVQTALIRSSMRAWAICDALWLDSETGQAVSFNNQPTQEGDILDRLFLGNFIVASTPLVAKQVLDQVGYFDESPNSLAGEDWDLWLRIAARYPVACVPEKLVTVRLHADSFLASMPMEQKLRNLEDVIDRAADREGRLRPLRNRALANIYYAAGVQAIRQQRMREARRHFGRALRRHPLHVEAMGNVLLTLLGASSVKAVARLKRQIWKNVS
jgi:glycosyltransferase involved in cell wall biosynthesis